MEVPLERDQCAVAALLLGGANLAAVSPALANSIYLKIPNVTGQVTNSGFLGGILLHAYSQGFTDPTVAATTGSSGAGAGKVSCGAISIVKSTSAATVPYTITLTNVRVTSIEQGDTVSNTSGLGITENISMVAEKVQFSYRPLNPDGTLGGAETYGWNCSTNSTF
jgi:type VI protein secretion system component Hcp